MNVHYILHVVSCLLALYHEWCLKCHNKIVFLGCMHYIGYLYSIRLLLFGATILIVLSHIAWKQLDSNVFCCKLSFGTVQCHELLQICCKIRCSIITSIISWTKRVSPDVFATIFLRLMFWAFIITYGLYEWLYVN